jgi:hypothetical protein
LGRQEWGLERIWMHLDLEIFPNNSRLFLKVLKNKTKARMRYDDDDVIDETKGLN